MRSVSGPSFVNALGFVFLGAIVSAAATAAGAVFVPGRRRILLAIAAGLLTVAGVIAIFSMGIVFLAGAAVCAGLAVRSPRERAGGSA